MKNSIKGALLSALIFPGFGHLLLKRYPRGIALILSASIALVVILAEAVRNAFAVIEKIGNTGAPIAQETIQKAVHQVLAQPSITLNAGLFFLALCWLVGIVDAYRIGKQLDGDRTEKRG